MAIYVGNLPYRTNEEELKDVFQNYGNVVSVKIIKDKVSGRSKGFAFVEMENDGDEQQAIERLEGFELSGRNLRVSKATQKREQR